MLKPKDKEKKSYTKFPEDFLEAIKEVFTESFEDQVQNAEFVVFGQAHQGEIRLRVGYLKKDSLAQINFDTSIEVSDSDANIISLIEDMVYGTKELFVDYFKNKNLENFSYQWDQVSSGSRKIFYKYDPTNTSLEEEANRLLGELQEEETLIHGDMEESMEIEKIIETLETSKFDFK